MLYGFLICWLLCGIVLTGAAIYADTGFEKSRMKMMFDGQDWYVYIISLAIWVFIWPYAVVLTLKRH